jgi:hypothetical protein
MVRTRNTNELHGDQPEGSYQAGEDNLPPPSPLIPTQMMAQFLASMIETQQQQGDLLREVLQQSAGRNAHRGLNTGPPQNSTYAEFLATHPPVFSEAAEPLDTNNWLGTIEYKFRLHCTAIQKTLFMVQ